MMDIPIPELLALAGLGLVTGFLAGLLGIGVGQGLNCVGIIEGLAWGRA